MYRAKVDSLDRLIGIVAADLSPQQESVNTGWKRWSSLPVDVTKKKTRAITKNDLNAFMGNCDPQGDEPFSSLKNDVTIMLKASMSPYDRELFVSPFESLHVSSASSSVVIVRDTLPSLADVSDCESDFGHDSEINLSEHSGIDCLKSARSIDANRIFSIMNGLMVLYDLDTCVVSIRENAGERLFVLHRSVSSEVWRTQMYIASADFSQLLVHRGIPTIIPDISKDPRFFDALDARSQLGRVFVQAPIGWKDDGSWIGVMNLIGKQALFCPYLHDYATLMARADEIASLARQQDHTDRQGCEVVSD